MRFIFIPLLIAALLLTIIIVGLTIFSILSGGGNILFPGLGLVVSLPFLIMLLAAFDVAIIVLTLWAWRVSGNDLGKIE
jgi:branched-subunit amino acid permease